MKSQEKVEKTKSEGRGFFAKLFGSRDKSPKKEKKKTPKVSMFHAGGLTIRLRRPIPSPRKSRLILRRPLSNRPLSLQRLPLPLQPSQLLLKSLSRRPPLRRRPTLL